MIECCEENIFKNVKRKNIKRKKKFKWLIIILVIAILFSYYKYVISKNIITITSSYAHQYSLESINSAVENSLKNKLNYDELVIIEKNTNGDIVLMRSNSYNVNIISRNIVANTQSYLDKKLSKGIPIPFMAFLGLELFNGLGAPINFKALTITSTNCNFISEFKSVGINQTLHSIYADISVLININFPLNNKEVSANSKVMLCEAVLIGDVPQIYLNGNIFR